MKAIVDWTFPNNQKDLRKWLGSPNNYTSIVRTMQIFLGHYPISLKRMWSGDRLAPRMMLLSRLVKSVSCANLGFA